MGTGQRSGSEAVDVGPSSMGMEMGLGPGCISGGHGIIQLGVGGTGGSGSLSPGPLAGE